MERRKIEARDDETGQVIHSVVELHGVEEFTASEGDQILISVGGNVILDKKVPTGKSLQGRVTLYATLSS